MSIALIDFSGLYRRHWAIVADGEDFASAPRNTVRDIVGIASQHEHVAICIDSPPYERSERFPEYKGTREKQPASCYELADRALDELRAAGFAVYGVKGQEADDVIASMIQALSSRGDGDPATVEPVVIYSSDKDLFSLVGGPVSVWSFALDATVDAAKVLERYGVKPHQMTDLLALTGDKSDNIPGVPGVGDKTAAKMLAKHGSIEAIARAAQAASDAYAEEWETAKMTGEENKVKDLPKVIQNIASTDLMLSLDLVTLLDDLPIDLEPLFAKREMTEAPEPKPITGGDIKEPPPPEEYMETETDTIAAEIQRRPAPIEHDPDGTREVFKALIAAQAEMPTVAKSATNPHFHSKYSTLDSIIDAVRPVLARHGLGFTQSFEQRDAGAIGVTTELVHVSGQRKAGTVWLPVDKKTPQGVGSAITYGRRYGLTALLGIASDTDNDGSGRR